MELAKLLSLVDHTLLRPDASWADIRGAVDDGIRFGTATVCIQADFISRAVEYSAGRVPVCTVVGFPFGTNLTPVKAYEAALALRAGAAEIDMVANIGRLKDGQYDFVLDDIRRVKEACGDHILKVIVETCLLTEDEKKRVCEIVSASGADFIKTSTGYAGGGATPEDVALLRAHSAPHLQVKAAGGIRTVADAENFVRLGASRLGTSAVVKVLKSEEVKGY